VWNEFGSVEKTWFGLDITVIFTTHVIAEYWVVKLIKITANITVTVDDYFDVTHNNDNK